MKRLGLLFVLLIFCGGYTKNVDPILWKDDYELVAEDFKCIPPVKSIHSAMSCIGIDCAIDPIMNGWRVRCIATFDPTRSWIKKKEATYILLKHEQGHFDLKQIGALETLIEIKKLSYPDGNILMNFIAIRDSVNRENFELNQQYDFETNHSQNLSKQYEWNEFIAKRLDSLQKCLNNTTEVLFVKP
jgi:hypothetical protein